MGKKIISIIIIVTFIAVVYLFLISYLDEKSVGLLESIIETEDTNLKQKTVALMNIAREKRKIIVLRYVYGSIIISYIIGIISYFYYKNRNGTLNVWIRELKLLIN